eukprot:CAMPEP_0171457120 /NCGR_PEP_ID=MMETSP0945-20130129/3327_1 /TAXON_ID=109269 /ORGANISM="Vaucheria litorea, Strain CCMP2940" /LENGTH=71 /DNA_ID=CAMNT_0011982667 /DNA_START=279 /DNA_END=491 /DNA_ORIENTATION=-
MARAMNTGPTIYKGLKEMDQKDRIDELRQRLLDKGAIFSNFVPTASEIKSAARKKEKMMELDGIDPKLIID